MSSIDSDDPLGNAMHSNVPAFRFEDGLLHRRVPTEVTFPNTEDLQKTKLLESWINPSLPRIESYAEGRVKSVSRAIEKRLRNSVVIHPDSSNLKFWPPTLFNYLFDENAVYQVVDELVKKGRLPVEHAGSRRTSEQAKTYWKGKICGTNGPEFRRVFAILLLMEKEERVEAAIDKALTDADLPLDRDDLDALDLGDSHLDLFVHYQQQFIVPLLAAQRDRIPRYELKEGHIKPWTRTMTRMQASSSLQDPNILSVVSPKDPTLGGAYGEVYQVIIHPWQHEYQNTLRSLSAHENLFALKSLHSRNKVQFEKECNMLKRFGGQRPNIVTLLATFACKEGLNNERYYLLFPWADSDLLGFWQKLEKPKRDHQNLCWISNQCYGIIDAIAYIHEPGITNDKNEPLYGRHGDIKPENVLWFCRDQKEILVLSDLGLAAEHRDATRSNIPGLSVPVTPNYRPPECDIDGPEGFINRSFDIWTLGCLFMEFIVWILRGWEGRQRFKIERCSTNIDVAGKDIYYEVMRSPDEEDKIVFKIKDVVEEWFASLHEHDECSQYIHDFLDLIQRRMLIVESADPPVKRITAEELLKKMKELKEKCSDPVYCLDRCLQKTADRQLDPVKAPPSKNMLNVISSKKAPKTMQQYSGRVRTANRRSDPSAVMNQG